MSRTLFRCEGGQLVLPDAASVLMDRKDGGNLVVLPPRKVWERSELTAGELIGWSCLVAASGRAMLDVLPQLDGGCINYWEAGNWALNDMAEPAGRKRAERYRSVHLHLLGRSPGATDPAWRWGESPRFPDYAQRLSWSANFARLTAGECEAVVERAESLLAARYGVKGDQVHPWTACTACSYPTAVSMEEADPLCMECQPGRRE